MYVYCTCSKSRKILNEWELWGRWWGDQEEQGCGRREKERKSQLPALLLEPAYPKPQGQNLSFSPHPRAARSSEHLTPFPKIN